MKVYALVEDMYEDYCGGGGTIQGIFSTRERAFQEVKKQIPKAKEDAEEWSFPKRPCVDHGLHIEEWDVQD